MNCKKIKELLITDYTDGEVSASVQREIQGHLNTCNECRQFQQALRKTAVEPFRNAKDLKPPDSVWGKIKETIDQEIIQQPEGLLADFKNFLQGLAAIRKPTFAFATAMTVVLIAAVFMRFYVSNQKLASGYFEEEIEFLAYLDAGPQDSNGTDYGLNTSIEEYFF